MSIARLAQEIESERGWSYHSRAVRKKRLLRIVDLIVLALALAVLAWSFPQWAKVEKIDDLKPGNAAVPWWYYNIPGYRCDRPACGPKGWFYDYKNGKIIPIIAVVDGSKSKKTD